MNEPGPKTEQAAWKTVSKAVDKLHDFYVFSAVLRMSKKTKNQFHLKFKKKKNNGQEL